MRIGLLNDGKGLGAYTNEILSVWGLMNVRQVAGGELGDRQGDLRCRLTDGLFPAVQIGHFFDRTTWSRVECVAGVERDRQQRALTHGRWNAEKL